MGSCSWMGSGSSRIDRLESASCPKVATLQACVPGPSRIGYSQGVLSGGGVKGWDLGPQCGWYLEGKREGYDYLRVSAQGGEKALECKP